MTFFALFPVSVALTLIGLVPRRAKIARRPHDRGDIVLFL